jgi:hypothetical protein
MLIHGSELHFLIKTSQVFIIRDVSLSDLLFSGVKRRIVQKDRSRNLT